MTRVLADAAKMIAKGAPHVIHNDKELEAYTNALQTHLRRQLSSQFAFTDPSVPTSLRHR
jgi:hypothetical protein